MKQGLLWGHVAEAVGLKDAGVKGVQAGGCGTGSAMP